MRALIQRVTQATVRVDGEVVGEIGRGLVALVGVTHDDGGTQAAKLADKVWNLRVFEDGGGKMNRSASDEGLGILVVSQFTLYGDTTKGRRPSFVPAAAPERAEPLIDRFVELLRDAGADVSTGRFRTDMQVELTNDGPVTLMLEV